MAKSQSLTNTSVYSPFAGVCNDFENLFKHFDNMKTVRYTQFLQLWKEMHMPYIFAGRQTDRECREFTEECLKVALSYCWDKPLQAKIFGLYLLYGLCFTYPFMPRVKIRVTKADWNELLNLLVEIHTGEHLDAEFVFLKLRYGRAFHFVATRSECQPVPRGNTGDTTGEMQQQKLEMLIQQKSIISELFESDTIDQLAAIHEEYHRVKCALSGHNATLPDSSLCIIENGLIQMLTKSVTAHEDWRKTRVGKKLTGRHRRDSGHTTSESEADSEAESVGMETSLRTSRTQGSIRAEIKARAFSSSGTVPLSRRYMQSVTDADVVRGTEKSPTKSRTRSSYYSAGQLFEADEPVEAKSETDPLAECSSMPCINPGDTETSKKRGRKKRKDVSPVRSHMLGKKKEKTTLTSVDDARKTPAVADSEKQKFDNSTSPVKKRGRQKKVSDCSTIANTSSLAGFEESGGTTASLEQLTADHEVSRTKKPPASKQVKGKKTVCVGGLCDAEQSKQQQQEKASDETLQFELGNKALGTQKKKRNKKPVPSEGSSSEHLKL